MVPITNLTHLPLLPSRLPASSTSLHISCSILIRFTTSPSAPRCRKNNPHTSTTTTPSPTTQAATVAITIPSGIASAVCFSAAGAGEDSTATSSPSDLGDGVIATCTLTITVDVVPSVTVLPSNGTVTVVTVSVLTTSTVAVIIVVAATPGVLSPYAVGPVPAYHREWGMGGMACGSGTGAAGARCFAGGEEWGGCGGRWRGR
ncbi:hypothetical protein EX30DRAFT_367328 [Ascodesmis nigricans]|uniref:Uncharacterized protein n=1 Tax=Ascodesmis nigricans TaxID=341454 RepID=A0A4S2MMZ5_9PEZI|nr:hypothetical protein EX30DRAFT_367328 [Ascodesmis nigricans]